MVPVRRQDVRSWKRWLQDSARRVGKRHAMIDDISALGPVRNGVDGLANDDFKPLHNRRIAIVTNHTGRLLDGTRTIDALAANPEVQLDVLFSPEHGLDGISDVRVDDSRDEVTQIPVYSLFGKRMAPSPEQLHNIDVLLYDIQDVG